MLKAKAKADRAAARQATQTVLADALMNASTPAESPAEEQPPQDVTMTDVAEEFQDSLPSTSVSAPPAKPDRTELLRAKAGVVGRFMQLIVPILIDVYAATVATPLRLKTLTGLLKATSFLDGEGIKSVLMVWPKFLTVGALLTLLALVCPHC